MQSLKSVIFWKKFKHDKLAIEKLVAEISFSLLNVI